MSVVDKSRSILHLYRHILRECTYLPPAFRPVIVSTIQDRFHRYMKYDSRQSKHIKRAENVLRTLRAANSGHKPTMTKLIERGFGRAGNRRRLLMAEFVLNEGPSDSQALESLLSSETKQGNTEVDNAQTKKKRNSPKNALLEKWDQKKLLKALESQRTQQKNTKLTATWPNRPVKSVDPNANVPKTNIWGKPPAESLVRTKQANWWKRNSEKIMPPLAKGEWELLKKLSDGAQGQNDEWQVPPRRTRVGDATASQDERTASIFEQYALQPGATVERPKSGPYRKRSGQVDQGPYGSRSNNIPLSDRWYRRAYNRVWQISSTMKQDPNTLQQKFIWGSSPSRMAEPSQDQLSIFENVDKRGRPQSEKK